MAVTGTDEIMIERGGTLYKAPVSEAVNATNVAAAGGVLSDPTGVTGADVVTNIVSLLQAEYDDIVTPNASTIYVITDA